MVENSTWIKNNKSQLFNNKHPSNAPTGCNFYLVIIVKRNFLWKFLIYFLTRIICAGSTGSCGGISFRWFLGMGVGEEVGISALELGCVEGSVEWRNNREVRWSCIVGGSSVNYRERERQSETQTDAVKNYTSCKLEDSPCGYWNCGAPVSQSTLSWTTVLIVKSLLILNKMADSNLESNHGQEVMKLKTIYKFTLKPFPSRKATCDFCENAIAHC